MIEVRTGYYRQIRKYREKGYHAIAISHMGPRWAMNDIDRRIFSLAPTQSILDTLPDEALYTKRFREEVLSKADAQKLYAEEIEHYARMAGRDKAVLLCYESAEKFCHRHLVAQWFKEQIGLEVTEIGKEELK